MNRGPVIPLEIKGFIPNTMLDWEGMLASTVFLPGCNFRCPFCQNPDLVLHPERLETVSIGVVERFLAERKGWIEGVCITGGEPCLNGRITELCARFRELGLGVKLDTNGSLPGPLEGLLEEGLLDFVAMDVKAPVEPGPYRMASGCDRHDLVDSIRRSIELLRSSGVDHEFRTTVVPIMHGPPEVEKIAMAVAGDERLVLQNFDPKVTLDPRYSELRPFTGEDMRRMADSAARHVDEVVIRGAPPGFDGPPDR